MEDSYQEGKPLPYVVMSRRQIVQVIIVGLGVGLTVWLSAYVLEAYVLKAVLCHGNAIIPCASASQYASVAASIIASAAGLFALVKLQIFRPLLVVLAVAVSLWGLGKGVATLPLYGIIIVSGVLYALAYLAFVWIARIRLFWPAVILMVVLVIVIRLILAT